MKRESSSRMRPPWLALFGLIIAPAVFLLLVNWQIALNSNILELLPHARTSPQAEAARAMLNERLTYPVILRATAPSAKPDELLSSFREAALQPAFDAAFVIGDRSYENALRPVLQQHRETLFAARWLERRQDVYKALNLPEADFIPWLAQSSAQRLNAFLERPDSMAYADEIPTDPLLLLPSALEDLPPSPTTPNDELLAWIPVTVDPLTPEGQQAIFESLASLESQMRTQFPDYQQTASGVYDLAAASERQTKSEVTRLNIEMAAAVLVLLLILAGRPGFLLLTVAPVVVAALWCVSAGIIIFGHVHVIALAVSSVVLGLAVDYAVHLAAKRDDGNLRQAWPKVRLPLATSCVSTCFGFFFLMLSPMAALQQVGVMVPAGLIGSLLAVRYILPWLEPIAGAYRLRAFLEKPGPALQRKVWGLAALFVWLAAAIVLALKPSFEDNIKDFQAPIEETLLRYRSLADHIGRQDVNDRWYCFATSPAELLERLQQVRDQTNANDLLLPVVDQAAWQSFASQSKPFADAFRQSLDEEDYVPESFEPFFQNLDNASQWYAPVTVNAALAELAAKLQGPLQALIMTDGKVWTAVFDAPSGSVILPELRPFTSELAQQKSLNDALRKARIGITQSAAWGLLGISVCVAVLFRRRAGWTLALPAWSVTLGVAATVLLGQPLGLLAVIGAILAFCLALDYGAFAATSDQPPSSIRISAATTGCGFLILSFCSMPAVAQLGQVVVASVFFAWLGAELMCLPQAKAAPQSKFV